MTRRLSISILSDGTIAAEASGTPGPDCLSALDQLRHMLAAEISDSKPTPEFSADVATVILKFGQEQGLEDKA